MHSAIWTKAASPAFLFVRQFWLDSLPLIPSLPEECLSWSSCRGRTDRGTRTRHSSAKQDAKDGMRRCWWRHAREEIKHSPEATIVLSLNDTYNNLADFLSTSSYHIKRKKTTKVTSKQHRYKSYMYVYTRARKLICTSTCMHQYWFKRGLTNVTNAIFFSFCRSSRICFIWSA